MGSRSLESIVRELEHGIGTADTKLDKLAWRAGSIELTNFSSVPDEPTCMTGEETFIDGARDEEVILLRELLTELAQLKQSYASLRSELQQVHSMHADLTQALRQKVNQVQYVFSNLRTRFSKHCKDGIMN